MSIVKFWQHTFFKPLAILLIFFLLTFSIVGCGGGGDSADGSSGQNSGYIIELSDVTHLPEDAFEKINGTTNINGGITIYSYDLDKDIVLNIEDEESNPIQGVDANFAFLNQKMIISIHDPLNVFAPTIINADLHNHSISNLQSNSQYTPHSITIGTAVLVTIKLVKIASAIYAAKKIGDATRELYDFHINNFEDFSLRTLTYKTTVSEVGDLLLSSIQGGLALITVAEVISTGGVSLAVPKQKVFEVTADFIGEYFYDELISILIESTIDMSVGIIGPDTEVYLKYHYWGSLIPPYKGGIEIIPILSNANPSTSQLIGTWLGNWNNYTGGSSGRAKMVINSVADSSFEGLIWDLDYSETFSISIVGYLRGIELEFSFTDPDDPSRQFFCTGHYVGSTLTLDWSSTKGETGSMSYHKSSSSTFSTQESDSLTLNGTKTIFR